MLGEYPEALSLFEYFNGLDATRRFDAAPHSGSAFADLVSAEQPFVTAVLRRGYDVAEITYPYPHGRFAPGEPLPWVLVSMLPRMTGDPDALFDRMLEFLRKQPDRPMVEHHRALFEWLLSETNKKLWIERSGSSIDYLAALDSAFPKARFLHIHRDGREAALSMREHHAYRLPISRMYSAPTDSGKSLAELGPLDLHANPTADDPVTQVLNSRPPAQFFGQYWTDQILRGAAARRALPAERYAEVAFEALVSDPRAELQRIAAHFELDSDLGGWIERAAALVRGAPPTRRETLPREEACALDAVCEPGMRELER
jgi:putative sulfotransferase